MFKTYKLDLILIAGLIAIDQITKAIAIAKGTIVVNKFLKFNFQANYGFAFSLLSGFGAKNQLVLACISMAILPVIYYFFCETKPSTMAWLAKILVVAGTLSNVTDRIFRGFVVDFISFSTFGLQWSIFNLADTFIIVGLGYLYLKTLSDEAL